eukprot:311320-Chlamydomonas_euryale.AAC.2
MTPAQALHTAHSTPCTPHHALHTTHSTPRTPHHAHHTTTHTHKFKSTPGAPAVHRARFCPPWAAPEAPHVQASRRARLATQQPPRPRARQNHPRRGKPRSPPLAL